MAYQVEVRTVPERYAAVERFHAKLPELGAKMPAAYGKVMSLLGSRRIAVKGPAMGRFRPTDEAEFDVEAGFYVDQVADSGDGVEFIAIPGGRAAVVTHVGPYEGLPAAYEAIGAWAKEQGIELGETMSEDYWSDPSRTPSSEWRTDVIWPLKTQA